MYVCKLWRAGKRGQGIRHTLDAPALEYVPAVQEAHVADEFAPVAFEYVPATQSVHSEAPAVQAQRQTARSSRAFEIQKDGCAQLRIHDA